MAKKKLLARLLMGDGYGTNDIHSRQKHGDGRRHRGGAMGVPRRRACRADPRQRLQGHDPSLDTRRQQALQAEPLEGTHPIGHHRLCGREALLEDAEGACERDACHQGRDGGPPRTACRQVEGVVQSAKMAVAAVALPPGMADPAARQAVGNTVADDIEWGAAGGDVPANVAAHRPLWFVSLPDVGDYKAMRGQLYSTTDIGEPFSVIVTAGVVPEILYVPGE